MTQSITIALRTPEEVETDLSALSKEALETRIKARNLELHLACQRLVLAATEYAFAVQETFKDGPIARYQLDVARPMINKESDLSKAQSSLEYAQKSAKDEQSGIDRLRRIAELEKELSHARYHWDSAS